ncbi:unnamed protein product, partial [Iphiclides podalirius]
MRRARTALAAAVCLALLRAAESQPTVCKLNLHCPPGFYCDADSLVCRECLRCEDLKRAPPQSATPCVKSVVECGPCDKGLVEDHRGDVNAQCVPRRAGDEYDGFPMYGWVLVALLCIVVLTLFSVIVWYVLKHPDTLKVLASTSTSMQSRCDRSVVPPTAPDQPPPYRALYSTEQPAPPSPPPAASPYHPSPPFNNDPDLQPNDEESSLFIKRPVAGGGWAARESAGSQAARVYNNPAYVRGAQPPHGYESASSQSAKGPKVTEEEEDTMESTWTPTESADQNDNTPNGSSGSSSGDGGATSSQLPALLAVARSTTLVRAPPPDNALLPYVRQDPNNNASRGSGEASSVCGEGDSSSNPGHGGSSFIINVIQNINTLPQRSDVGH